MVGFVGLAVSKDGEQGFDLSERSTPRSRASCSSVIGIKDPTPQMTKTFPPTIVNKMFLSPGGAALPQQPNHSCTSLTVLSYWSDEYLHLGIEAGRWGSRSVGCEAYFPSSRRSLRNARRRQGRRVWGSGHRTLHGCRRCGRRIFVGHHYVEAKVRMSTKKLTWDW